MKVGYDSRYSMERMYVEKWYAYIVHHTPFIVVLEKQYIKLEAYKLQHFDSSYSNQLEGKE